MVVRGERLRIEHREGEGEPEEVELAPGLCGWDEPADRVQRAVNAGASPYEEVTVFFLDAPEAGPQPPGGQG